MDVHDKIVVSRARAARVLPTKRESFRHTSRHVADDIYSKAKNIRSTTKKDSRITAHSTV